MTTDSEQPDMARWSELARAVTSVRLRGVMRHSWLNEGFDQFPLATRIHWGTSVEEANILRVKLGLAALRLEDDPAPSLSGQNAPDRKSTQFTNVLAENGRPVLPPGHKQRGTVALPLGDAFQWSGTGRLLIFLLASTSIGCMVVDNEGIVTTRSFFFAVLLPAFAAIAAIANANRRGGDCRLYRAIMSGVLAGLGGAVVLNLVRLPFVYSAELGLGRLGIPQLPFFNLYPRIGAILLGQPVKQPSYEVAMYAIGWGYHIIRTMATGVMFAMAIGELRAEIRASTIRRNIAAGAILRGVLLTVIIQSLLLLSPYAKLFAIELTPHLVFIILLAHVSFGIAISILYAWRLPMLTQSSLA